MNKVQKGCQKKKKGWAWWGWTSDSHALFGNLHSS